MKLVINKAPDKIPEQNQPHLFVYEDGEWGLDFGHRLQKRCMTYYWIDIETLIPEFGLYVNLEFYKWWISLEPADLDTYPIGFRYIDKGTRKVAIPKYLAFKLWSDIRKI